MSIIGSLQSSRRKAVLTLGKKNKPQPKKDDRKKGLEALAALLGGGDSKSEPVNAPKNASKSAPANEKYKLKPVIESAATAPYNFVSLPSKPLPSPMEDDHSQLLSANDDTARNAFRDYIRSHEHLSGEIELDIKALTPLFIGGNVSDDKLSFAPVGTPILPGSSLRGMFKNIFKIVTCGAFRGGSSKLRKGEDFNDEHIYYRCIMKINKIPWTADLHSFYSARMTNNVKTKAGKTVPVKNARPGFLIKLKNGKFMIAPSIYAHDQKDDRILILEYEKKFGDRLEVRGSRVTWQGREAYIITGSQRRDRLYDEKSYANLDDEQKKKAGKQFIRFTSIDHVDWSREHWIELSDELRASYEHDRNRRGVNLFKEGGILKRDRLQQMVKNLPADVQTLVPCHFLIEDGELTAFGHGQCFRIPYRNRIGDAVPERLRSNLIDFADALFGRASFWASRVYFDDAKPLSQPKTLPTDAAHPLMQPNPTSYQLYLKQGGDKLNHWDSERTRIRGYKLYWHNAVNDWKANDSERALDRDKSADKRLTRDITPLDKGSRFKSKIRFDNLSAIELGALLMIFDLDGQNKNAAYKLGKGKPFGFGSIKVTTKLFVESNDAYDDMISADGWINPLRAEDAQKYLEAFKKYLLDRNMNEKWGKVMGELNAMLYWRETNVGEWSKRIKSMSNDMSNNNVDEKFEQRAPLPSIFDILSAKENS